MDFGTICCTEAIWLLGDVGQERCLESCGLPNVPSGGRKAASIEEGGTAL